MFIKAQECHNMNTIHGDVLATVAASCCGDSTQQRPTFTTDAHSDVIKQLAGHPTAP